MPGTVLSTLPSGNSRCIYASHTSGSLEYKSDSCDKVKPILCYVAGRFRIAKNVDTNGNRTLRSGTFGDAARICFEQGKEIVKATEFEAVIYTMDASIAQKGQIKVDLSSLKSGGFYQGVNVARQGIFLSPDAASISTLEYDAIKDDANEY